MPEKCDRDPSVALPPWRRSLDTPAGSLGSRYRSAARSMTAETPSPFSRRAGWPDIGSRIPPGRRPSGLPSDTNGDETRILEQAFDARIEPLAIEGFGEVVVHASCAKLELRTHHR